MTNDKLRPCHCGGEVRVVEPDSEESFERIIFCYDCTGIWNIAIKVTREELIAAWNGRWKPE